MLYRGLIQAACGLTVPAPLFFTVLSTQCILLCYVEDPVIPLIFATCSTSWLIEQQYSGDAGASFDWFC